MPDADSRLEKAKRLFLDGLACFEAGRLQDAEERFAASLELLPDRISTLVNLAATRLGLSRPQDALAVADRILALEPDNLDAWFHRATALARLGRHADALAAYDKVLAIDPGLAQVWTHRGSLLREMHRLDEAAESFRQALARGGDAELNGYYLASVGGEAAPAAAPGHYVQALFDDYAEQFEGHVVRVLLYRAPEVLVRQLRKPASGRFRSVLDLGCGTGLCGPLMRPMADRLTGVDLSERMLGKARALGVYDRLAQADVAEFLRSAEETYDLVIAADVFVYIGDLSPVFDGVRRVLEAGGAFCFSVEMAGDERDFELLPSLRYAHSERHLKALAARHGFRIERVQREPIREDQRQSIDGLYVHLTGTP